jgi:hypothetical protein
LMKLNLVESNGWSTRSTRNSLQHFFRWRLHSVEQQTQARDQPWSHMKWLSYSNKRPVLPMQGKQHNIRLTRKNCIVQCSFAVHSESSNHTFNYGYLLLAYIIPMLFVDIRYLVLVGNLVMMLTNVL